MLNLGQLIIPDNWSLHRLAYFSIEPSAFEITDLVGDNELNSKLPKFLLQPPAVSDASLHQTS